MILEFVEKWESNKHKLKDYFKTTPQSEFATSYDNIVKMLFDICLEDLNFDTDKMTVIDDGEYQGTQIFIVPKKTYQPSASDYVITDTYYGSCSGCDTLESIREYRSNLPTDEQVDEYMLLALHLFQKLRWLDTEEE